MNLLERLVSVPSWEAVTCSQTQRGILSSELNSRTSWRKMNSVGPSWAEVFSGMP